MALGAISGVNNNNDMANLVQKNDLGNGTSNLNITELPGMAKSPNSSVSGKNQGQNGNSVSDKAIKDAVSQANSRIKAHYTKCEFSYHEETKSVSIKVVDNDTQEVIREIPPEETLEMLAKLWDLAGIMVDERR